MHVGMIGLGRMGGNMVTRLLKGGHKVTVWNRGKDPVKKAVSEGASEAPSIKDMPRLLPKPRCITIMLPAGQLVDDAIKDLLPGLEKGDVVIDGGNSNYKDSQRRYAELKPKGIHFMDQGTSGGIWGLTVGYCIMIGGDPEGFKIVEPALKTLAPKDGYLHCGASGSGHFVKMVHNGVEYGMMQAYGEGFHILKASGFGLDLRKVSHLWNQGSVVRSWLLELAEDAFSRDPNLEQVKGYVEDSGEGRWTVMNSIENGVAAPVLALSLYTRFLSREQDNFANKVLAALRRGFGGHAVVGSAPIREPAGAKAKK